jgi:hypothetical protein
VAAVQAPIAQGYLQALLAGSIFMRVQFQMPSTPTTPCTSGCSFTGNESLRYKSLSFQDGSNTLLSLKDSDFVKDPSGNVTLIVSLGAVPPSQVTPANYYTYVDMTQRPNYQNLKTLFVRDLLPNAAYLCSAFNVPFKTTVFNPDGGYMGAAQMTVDFPNAAGIPAVPVPPVRPDSCAIVPVDAPTTCPTH